MPKTINDDLANAVGVIILPSAEGKTKTQLTTQMLEKYELLKKNPFDQDLEKILLLLGIIINLVIDAYQQNNEEKMLHYWSELFSYYQRVEITSELSDLQKAKWAALVANAYQQTEHYEKAIFFYKKALIKEKDLDTAGQIFIQNTRVQLIGVYLKLAYQHSRRNAVISATTRYQDALALSEEALKASHYLNGHIYYLQAQTLVYLADLAIKQKQENEADVFFRQALYADYCGFKLVENPLNQQRYIKHIEQCCKKWLEFSQKNSGLSDLLVKKLPGLSKKIKEKNASAILENLKDIFEPNKFPFWNKSNPDFKEGGKTEINLFQLS